MLHDSLSIVLHSKVNIIDKHSNALQLTRVYDTFILIRAKALN